MLMLMALELCPSHEQKSSFKSKSGENFKERRYNDYAPPFISSIEKFKNGHEKNVIIVAEIEIINLLLTFIARLMTNVRDIAELIDVSYFRRLKV